MAPTDEFEALRERAAEDIEDDDVVSLYVGLIHEDQQDAYYFANDVDEDDLQAIAARQMGILTRVLASRSELGVEEVTKLAAEHARDLDLGP